jgi:hypothetical protein
MGVREIVFETPRPAWVAQDEGRAPAYQPVDVIGETEHHYRIWARVRTRLAGRDLHAGARALVPKVDLRWKRPTGAPPAAAAPHPVAAARSRPVPPRGPRAGAWCGVGRAPQPPPGRGRGR